MVSQAELIAVVRSMLDGQPRLGVKAILARIRAVWRVMKAPDAFAIRLARTLQRIKAKDEPRPNRRPHKAGAYRKIRCVPRREFLDSEYNTRSSNQGPAHGRK